MIMKNEKLFEVILTPTDMLEKELESVFGGAYGINGYRQNTGNCNINDCQRNSKPKLCPLKYTWNRCECVPVDIFKI